MARSVQWADYRGIAMSGLMPTPPATFSLAALCVSRWACLDSQSVSLWQASGLENGRCAGHIRGMEKTIALAVVVAIIAFVAIYSLFSLRRRK